MTIHHNTKEVENTSSKICFVSPKLSQFIYTNPDSAGGAERQQFLLAQELRSLGFEIEYITSSPNENSKVIDQETEVWANCPTDFEGMWGSIKNIFKFVATISKCSADYYYVRGLPRLAILTALAAKSTDGSILFCIAADSNVEKERLRSKYSHPVRFLYERMLASANVVSQTNSQAKMLQDNFGVDSTVIPNGCEITPEPDISSPRTGPDVLWVGRIEQKQKRPDRVLDLADRMSHVEFEIVGPLEGEDSYCDEFLNRVYKLNNVQYSGFVNPDDMVKKYTSAKILLNTSDYEGFPNTFLEAWQCEIPVVSQYYTFDGQLAELDFGFHSGDLSNTADTIMNLLKDDKHRKVIGERARKFVIDNYSIENVAKEYVTLLS